MNTTTIRLHRATIARLREHKLSPTITDDWIVNWVLDKLDSNKIRIENLERHLTEKKEV